MKKNLLLLITVLVSLGANAQNIVGQWNGVLKIQGTELRIVFNVSKTETGYSTTMDSPDQGAKGIPVTVTTFENPKIKFEITTARIEYNGEVKENEITGTPFGVASRYVVFNRPPADT